MQVPSDLTGFVVYVTEGQSPLRAFVCTDHQPTCLTGVPIEGGLFSRLTKLPLSQYTLLGFAYNQQIVAQTLQSVTNVLSIESVHLTDDGIESLKAARDALAVVLRGMVNENTRHEREMFDAELSAFREQEDASREAFFESIGNNEQPEPVAAQAAPMAKAEPAQPPIYGATFTESPWSQSDTPQSVGEPETLNLGGTQVRVYIVVEHENQEIVQKVTAAIRHQINEAIG